MGIPVAANTTTQAAARADANRVIETRLTGRWLTAARITWFSLAALMLSVFIAGLVASFIHVNAVCPTPACVKAPINTNLRDALAGAGLTYASFIYINIAISLIFAIPYDAVAFLIFWRRSDDRMALLTSLALLAFSLLTFTAAATALASSIPAVRLPLSVLIAAGSVLFTVFLYTFPTGRFVSRWVIWIAFVWAVQSFCHVLFPGAIVDTNSWPLPLQLLMWSGFFASVIYAQVYRYRHSSNLVHRQQTKWVVYGITTALTGYLVTEAVLVLAIRDVNHLTPDSLRFALVGNFIATLTLLIVPLSIGVAMMRYRLFDIDVLINRTLVYGALTLFVIGLYVLIVGGFSVVFQAQRNAVVALLATGIVAVAVQPVRQRLQGGVNRLIYGQRDDPYAVLSELGRRLEVTLEPDAVLPTIVETVATALKLPYVAIALGEGEGAVIAASEGTPSTEPLRQPLIYQGETVGELILGPREPGGDWVQADKRLLDNLAQQAGIAIHSVRLNAELKRAREQLILAREEERRRLRRELHDGLGPQLASQTLTITAAARLLRQDPDAAEALLHEANAHAQAATADIRRVVYGLRPPALDALGLLGALQEQAEQYRSSGILITIETPGALPPLPAAFEVACFRIAQEAMTNVVRHAHATRCAITLALGETLALEISDNGQGIPRDQRAGVGLNSMRERAEELGGTLTVTPSVDGGTRVLVRLPMS
jgi:signal transduction histidine kinase